MNAKWTFSCESDEHIPLPPEYTFPQAFNYLNPKCNSFYILEAPNGDYLQLGGSKERCTVEHRIYHADGHSHYVLGRRGGSDTPTSIKMSHGEVVVTEREVFRHWDAIELFKLFFSGHPFPHEIVLRETNL